MLRTISRRARSTAGTVARRALARLFAETAQATAEYALVILGAAAVAGLLVTWATQSGAIGRLFDGVVGRVLDAVGR